MFVGALVWLGIGCEGPAGESVMTEALPTGSTECAFGGTRFVVGPESTVACNGAPGADGSMGGQGADGVMGTTGERGPVGEQGMPGTDGMDGLGWSIVDTTVCSATWMYTVPMRGDITVWRFATGDTLVRCDVEDDQVGASAVELHGAGSIEAESWSCNVFIQRGRWEFERQLDGDVVITYRNPGAAADGDTIDIDSGSCVTM